MEKKRQDALEVEKEENEKAQARTEDEESINHLISFHP